MSNKPNQTDIFSPPQAISLAKLFICRDFAGASRHYDRLLSHEPQNADYLEGFARCLRKLVTTQTSTPTDTRGGVSHRDEAIRAYERMLAVKPAMAEAHYHIAELSGGDYADGGRDLSKGKKHVALVREGGRKREEGDMADPYVCCVCVCAGTEYGPIA